MLKSEQDEILSSDFDRRVSARFAAFGGIGRGRIEISNPTTIRFYMGCLTAIELVKIAAEAYKSVDAARIAHNRWVHERHDGVLGAIQSVRGGRDEN